MWQRRLAVVRAAHNAAVAERERNRSLFNIPFSPIGITVVRIDSKKRPGFANRVLVSERIQTHGVLLPDRVVVFKAESVILLIQDSGDFPWLAGFHWIETITMQAYLWRGGLRKRKPALRTTARAAHLRRSRSPGPAREIGQGAPRRHRR